MTSFHPGESIRTLSVFESIRTLKVLEHYQCLNLELDPFIAIAI